MKFNKIAIAATSALAVVAGGTVAGAAVLAGPIDGAGVIHGCYYPATSTGSHRVVLQNAGRKCPGGTTAISWNRVGRTGPKGATGPRGPQGPQGPPGAGGPLPNQLTLGTGVPDQLSTTNYRFSAPDQIAYDGTHLWVVNSGGNSVTEINPADGSIVRVLSDPSYQFDDPQGVAFDGANLWIVNEDSNLVTEISVADGSLVGVFGGFGYGLNAPVRIAFDGTNMWVTNSGGNSVTELDSSGGPIEVLTNSSYQFARPFGIAYDGRGHLWIANNAGGSVTEINTDGSLVGVFRGLLEFIGPGEITFDGQHLWVADNGDGAVTEINATDGSLVRFVAIGGNTQDITYDGPHIWVTNGTGIVSEIDAGTGAVVNTLTAAAYGFKDTNGIAFADNHLWIADSKSNAVTAVQGP